jgi:hypothetical protein
MGSGGKIIEEKAKNACARPHSGIRLSVINKVDNDSMKGGDNNERNKTNNETANGDKDMSIGGSGFSLHSPGYNCEGGIVLNIHNNNICEGVHKKRATLWTLKIFVEAQGADLRRFDKHKKRATLGTGE